MESRFGRVFGAGTKPVIAMAHLPALPGAPLHDAAAGMRGVVDAVARDLDILLAEGVDAVMFCNENDRPYRLEASLSDAAAMARVVTELAPRDRPFGVDYLWDARCALAVAATTGASFIREVMPGVFESDMGLWRPDPAALLRERRALGADDVAVLMNVTPEFASPLGSRSAGARARSAVVSTLADAILVSGPMAGAEPDLDAVREIVDAVAGTAPVLLNTGAKSTNIGAFLPLVDGVIVGSDLKAGGGTWNPVERERVRRFLAAAHEARA
jgi:membrane complex biogenesis BtpA family protein